MNGRVFGGSVSRLLLLLVALGWAGPLAAVPLWSVQGDSGESEVLLLGSVHLLRAEDQPLPPAVHQAYGRAVRVVLELAPEALSPAAYQRALASVGITTPGRSVADVLSPHEKAEAERLARAAGLDLAPVAGLEPWFAALALYTAALAATGHDPALGVDQQVADWAVRDSLPTDGLETLEQQLLLFKELDLPTQRALLLKTLEELPALGTDAGALIGEWRNGDIEALAARLVEDFLGYEALRDQIVADRNRAWLPQVEALLEAPGTSLVVVGALHLVGPDGLPALLEARGWRLRRIEAR